MELSRRYNEGSVYEINRGAASGRDATMGRNVGGKGENTLVDWGDDIGFVVNKVQYDKTG